MEYGYTGKILHINLDKKSVEIEQPSEDFYRTYIGGSAMGVFYHMKFTPALIDAFDPANTLVYALGPATGAPISGQSRATVVAKSPITGGIGDAQAGGFWPAELRFAGFDALVIQGESESPVYIWIKDGAAELRDASSLWGMETRETEEALKQELGDDRIEVAQIGPAGEKLVRFAAIMNMSNRAHGRTGMGAVMGSKKLKAIVVRGTKKKINIADPERLKAITKFATQQLTDDEDMIWFGKYGTPGIVASQDISGGLPTRNFTSGAFGLDNAELISGERLYDDLLLGAEEGDQLRKGRDTCYACAVRCKRVVESEWKEKAINPESGGPEYETIATFGSYCGNNDLQSISYANQICNQYGVDTIAAGATIAFAIECFEKGILTSEETGGVELRWGNDQAIINMLEMIVNREGFGNLLAEGSARAAQEIGKGAENFVVAAKNAEFPAHMPQVKRSLALMYAVNPYGADHQSSEHDPSYSPGSYEIPQYKQRANEIGLSNPQADDVLNEAKVEYALVTQYAYSALDTFTVCQFVYGPAWQLLSMGNLAEMVSAVTGWDIDIEELLQVGARRVNMMRVYNLREGMGRADDVLPKRLFEEPLISGTSDGVSLDTVEFETALDEYYKQAGWDTQNGTPTQETLDNLGLHWLAEI